MEVWGGWGGAHFFILSSGANSVTTLSVTADVYVSLGS